MKNCKDVMTLDPFCCGIFDTLERIAEIMRDQDIGSVMVCDSKNKKLVGILTDRDITVKCVAGGKDPQTLTAESIMSREPVYCREDDSLQKAMDLMAEHQVRRMPIVDLENRLVGVISQGDIATHTAPKKAGSVVEQISQPPTQQYREEHTGVY